MRQQLFSLVVLLALSVLLIVGCALPGASANEPDGAGGDRHLSVEKVVARLQARGIAVERQPSINQPFFEPEGQVFTIDGESVQFFQFDSAAAAADAVANISPDGSQIDTSVISWIAEPHFYRSEALIALYVGDHAETVALLAEIFGPQLAGR